MIRTEEVKLSGYWLEGTDSFPDFNSVDEDLQVHIIYEIVDDSFDHEFGVHKSWGVDIAKIEGIYGERTGRDYTHDMPHTEALYEHLQDCIMELIEV